MMSPQTIFNGTKKIAVEEELNIKDFINKYFLYHWYLYLIFGGIGIGLAYVYLKSSNSVYAVKSRLLIKEEKNESFAPGDKLLKDLNLFGASENVSNEIQIISSFSLMNQVVNNLNLDVQFEYQTWIKTIPAYKNFPILLDTFSLSPNALNSSDYLLNGNLRFQIKPIDYEQFELTYEDNNLGVYPFGTLINNEFGSFKFLIQPPLNFKSDSTLHVNISDPELVTETYSKKLNTSLIDLESTIVELSIADEIPQRGLAVLNQLINIYNSNTIADKSIITQNSIKFIKERLVEITKELKAVEGNVERYKRKHEITSEAASDLGIAMQEMSKYTQEENKLAVELSILESMATFFDNSKEFDLIPANLSIANITLTSSIEGYNQLVLLRQKMLETATIANPQLISLEQQLKSSSTVIRATINNLKKNFRTKLNSVQNLNQDLSGRLAKVPTQERGLLEIKRQQVVKQNLYLFLLQKKEETALSLIATSANSKIVDAPRFEKKAISPQKSAIYLGGLLSGLSIPFIFIIGKLFFQSTISTEEEIKTITNAPIIGTISHLKKDTIIAVKKNSRSAVSERFRLTRTNLQFLNKKKKQQTILITSSVSGEGKTFIAINLALSFAITKQKTIVLGMDLRKPKLKEYLKSPYNAPGISELLAGKVKLKDTICTYPKEPNLDYISSGIIPFNPHELLLEETVSQLFTQLKEQYDIIIIDAPPVGLVSDALLLSEFTTDTIYVIRAGLTPKKMLEDANQLFTQKKLKHCSIIFNGINMTSGYGYKRYGHVEKYGYYMN